uniref:Uncharacterized protein n=1 Tax=Acrobeloides nanus TaxID=290746 RepID=A0A914C9R1_9BILA
MFTNNSYYNPSTNTNTADGGNIGKIDASTTTYDSNGCAHIKILCYAHSTTCSSAPSRTSPITTTIQTTTYQNRVNTETYESVLVMNSQLRKQIMTLEVERNNYRRQAHECQGKLGLEADQRRQAEAEVKILNAEVDKNLRMLSEMTVNSAVPSSFFDLFLNKYH